MRGLDDDKTLLLAFAGTLRAALRGVPLGPAPLSLRALPITAPWTPGVSELNLLARPFLETAGLGHLDVFVELYDGAEKLRGLPDDEKTRPAHDPVAWFTTVEEGLCILGAEETEVKDAARCVADLAHAAARALWFEKGLELPRGAPLGDLADVTAVLLGLGLCLLPRPPCLSARSVLLLLADCVRHRDDIDPAVVEDELPRELVPNFRACLVDA